MANAKKDVSQTKMPKHRLSAQDKAEWSELYEFVRQTVFGYDKAQALPAAMVYKLKGLRQGQFIANNRAEDKADYPYKVILNTFKACMPAIENVLRNKSFDTEQKKFNYISRILENNLNDVYLRMKKAKKAQEEAGNVDLTDAFHYVNTFKAKPEKASINKFDDLW